MKSISPILITGAAGFIGSAISIKLLKEFNQVIGVDNLNDYYDPNLKKRRLNKISEFCKTNSGDWHFFNFSIENEEEMIKLFERFKPKVVINLAAQAGVRYSIVNPHSYLKSNLDGFYNILELSRRFSIENFLFASSSSVYGGNKNLPFKESNSVDHPVSFYGATKKCNELMAHSYSHIYGIPVTGLRFFTVYGPWGRPDMAPMIFANSILHDLPINIFNEGEMMRDFTYIDDIVESIYRCCYKPATVDKEFDRNNPNPSTSFARFRIFNIGNGQPTKLLTFIELLEKAFNKKAIKEFKPMQPGDIKKTLSDNKALMKWIKYRPITNLEKGIEKFAKWYLNYYCL